MLVRSPMTTKPNSGVMFSGSSPERLQGVCVRAPFVVLERRLAAADALQFRLRAVRNRAPPSAIARMCSGVVPQQPPTMLSQPFAAHVRKFGRE